MQPPEPSPRPQATTEAVAGQVAVCAFLEARRAPLPFVSVFDLRKDQIGTLMDQEVAKERVHHRDAVMNGKIASC